MGHVTGQQPGAALYLAATWGQCVCVGALSSWLGGCSRCSQPGRVVFFLTSVSAVLQLKASGVLPTTFCLPPTLWSFTPLYWVGSRENICFPRQSFCQEIRRESDSACSPSPHTCYIFFLPCFCLTASPPLGPLSPNYPSTLTLLLLLLFILLLLLLLPLSRHRAPASLPVCSSFQALMSPNSLSIAPVPLYADVHPL